ncbi:MAG: transcription-repair coupling factor [Longimicrobiales bacterium]
MAVGPSAHPLITRVRATEPFLQLLNSLPERGEKRTVGGAVGSLPLVVISALAGGRRGHVTLLVAPTPARASEYASDLEQLLGPDQAVLYPQRETLAEDAEDDHLEISGQRIEAIESIMSGRTQILITTRRALQEVAWIPDELADLRLRLAPGDQMGPTELIDALEARGLVRAPMVEEVGQFAVRGGLVDLFSFGTAGPARVEFWGDEIESIRLFDIFDQRSTETVEVANVLPIRFQGTLDRGRTSRRSLLDLFGPNATIMQVGTGSWEHGASTAWEHADRFYQEALAHGNPATEPGALFLEVDDFLARVDDIPQLSFVEEHLGDPTFPARPPPPIERDSRKLRSFLSAAAAEAAETFILCDNEGQAHRLEELVADRRGQLLPGVTLMVGSLTGGFRLTDPGALLNVLTDHEIFRRKRRLRRSRRFRGAAALQSLAQLSPGDYVVHLEHGIGQFRGLERVTVDGKSLEVLVIAYDGEELLRVPVYRLDQIERWVGGDPDAKPRTVHKIGGKRWKAMRRKTEAAIEQMTAELLELYATRQTRPGHAFSPDSRWQKEMEASFLYEDTVDQGKAADDVKRDMESSGMMDRLICGDVGYGKTEVAIRAAFKAVQDGKQVGVLAPTTILAEQHAKTFSERLADYPVEVGALSRFRGAKERGALLEEIALGKTDIVIGTHRLLSGDVTFKDLGLLIIDEEQRFGVKHKERLKRLKASVDVLTLSATPIPRTLYLSLAGIRDLSVIRTPPRDRMPIITHVVPWSDRLLAEAMQREVDRGGQVFFLHNRIETLDTIAERVRRLVDATVDSAHGQMKTGELDRAMTRFVSGKTQVLVCSSIIENGLDVPNANTLIVDRADRFGLSQLYQIRGRVGRSDRRAFCYLVVPDDLTEDAEKRLKVLEHYTELGSGYQVAMKDLELRGAGNLLGEDQSGFAHAVGLDTYLRLLDQTVRRMTKGQGPQDFPRPEVQMDDGAFLPDAYIEDEHQKLAIYRRLSAAETRAEVEAVQDELVDRFGSLPEEAQRLVDQRDMALVGQHAGIDRILIRGQRARLNFRPDIVPRMSALEQGLEGADVSIEVRRIHPLSIFLVAGNVEALPAVVVQAMQALAPEKGAAETGNAEPSGIRAAPSTASTS